MVKKENLILSTGKIVKRKKFLDWMDIQKARARNGQIDSFIVLKQSLIDKGEWDAAKEREVEEMLIRGINSLDR